MSIKGIVDTFRQTAAVQATEGGNLSISPVATTDHFCKLDVSDHMFTGR